MLISNESLFSDSQNITATGASTNIIDLGATGTVLGAPAALTRDIGKGNPIPVVVRLGADASGTSPTLDVSVQVDTVANFASPTTVAAATQKAGGTDGDEIYLDVYLPEGTNQRYLRLLYTLGGTNPDYTITAFIPAAKQSNSSVPGA